MKGWRIALVFLVMPALAIKVFSFFPFAVEQYYTGKLYPLIHSIQFVLFGSLPFSFGDCIYGLVILMGLYLLVRILLQKIGGKLPIASWKVFTGASFLTILTVYIFFNTFWGLNYNRPGMDSMFGLDSIRVEKQDLKELMDELVEKVNALDSSAHSARRGLANAHALFKGAVEAYHALSLKDERFTMNTPSIKSSLFGSLGNYLGYTGYYNPFTGEAQVNTAVPLFLQPFTSCHELGHLLGYARENEANFAGYLAASASADPAFQYSVYLDMFLYGRSYFKKTDSLAIKKWDLRLDPLVRKDIEELKTFLLRHQNPLEKIIDRVYDSYLQANQQPEGKRTYGKVIYWLAAYRKKHGII